MLDMGFLPDIRRVLRHIPTKRQTLFFSATMPPPIAQLSREMLHNPVTINLERRSAPATGITQAVYPVPQPLKAPLLLKLLQRGDVQDALVFTRTKHRANRLAKLSRRAQGQRRAHPRQPLAGAAHRRRWRGSRTGATRCSSRPTSPRAASTSTALGHVINFDVPVQPEDYIHRVGRTARAELTGIGVHAGVAGGRRRPARHRAGDRQAAAARHGARLRLRARARPSGSRCRTRSASRRSARARPRSARAPAPTPSGGRTR